MKMAGVMAILTMAGGAWGQSGVAIQNVAGRKTVSLNGSWQAIVDPFLTGYYDYRWQPDAEHGFGANRKPQSKSELVEYDFDRSARLQVPGDWNTQRPDLMLYEGAIWYKRDFDYKLEPGRRLFVHFGAANYHATVLLNGKLLGEHVGGYTPFAFEITGLVREKGNFLIAMVENQRRMEGVPTVNTDWWNYGGLTRDVQLLEEPETFVQDYSIQLEKGSRQRVAGWVRLNGTRPRQKVTVEIPEAGAAFAATTDEQGYAKVAGEAQLTLWSPEEPKLYEVVVEAETDRVRDSIGFRTIETSGANILLNGKPIFLRGITMHAEAPYRTGRAWSEDDARTLLGWAKELHANFVRLAHYPHDERMVRLADRMGLLVWAEIPVYWTIQFGNPETYANAENQLREMIARDKNRASVILWSVGNETPQGEARLSFLKGLVERARREDPARLITAALQAHYADPTTEMLDDPLGQFLDVLGCNEYVGWYDGPPEKADRTQWKTPYDKPVVMSEFGGGALQGYHGDELTIFTEEFQRRVYQHQIGMLKRIGFLRGTSPWVLMDFRSPKRMLPGIQDYFNRKGLVSERGQKKAAFFTMQQFYEWVEKEGLPR
ncbi:MAG: glycoside hydrolase family 2 protein [Bryobacteraceae bacterium]